MVGRIQALQDYAKPLFFLGFPFYLILFEKLFLYTSKRGTDFLNFLSTFTNDKKQTFSSGLHNLKFQFFWKRLTFDASLDLAKKWKIKNLIIPFGKGTLFFRTW